MARILILGGTAWLGREIARAAVANGDEVTCLARGHAGDVAHGARLVTADREVPGSLEAVAATDWDEIVDVSWQPGQVDAATAVLGDRTAHWTYISSISVYAEGQVSADDEEAPIVGPWPGDQATLAEYAEAKVRCEELVRERLGSRALIARAGLLVGPGDPTDRFGYWVGRWALAGAQPVLVPDAPAQPVQVLDARDLARWAAGAAAGGSTGVMDTVGPRTSLGQLIEESRAAAGATGDLMSVDAAWLLERDVAYWSGPRSLPLWLPPESTSMMTRSGARAQAAGLTTRPLGQTLRDTLVDETERGLGRDRRAGLTRDQELDLIRRLS